MAYFFIINEEIRNRRVQRQLIRDFSNPFDLPDSEFQKNYRLNKDMALYLCNQLEGDISIRRRDGIPAHIRILAAVNYMITGAYQRKVGQDHNLAIAQTTVSKYLGQIVAAINHRLKPRWIVFPGTEDARRMVTNEWREKSGLPDILGAIDCTHVSIFPPPRPQGLQYINRKRYHSINVQLSSCDHGNCNSVEISGNSKHKITDAKCKILNVNAQYPGRVHDQFIFNNSVIKDELQRLHRHRIGAYYLLGDSGYALEPWMMTPVLHAEPGSPEDRYTSWHCQNRNVVERVNGYLKGSFRCLGIDQNLHYSPGKACSIIYACCTLYNMMQYFRVPLEYEDLPVEEEVAVEDREMQPVHLQQFAIAKRNEIIYTYFN